jgi:hypothetical protein
MIVYFSITCWTEAGNAWPQRAFSCMLLRAAAAAAWRRAYCALALLLPGLC